MKKKAIAFVVLVSIVISSALSEEPSDAKIVIDTNLAYLAMTAFMTSNQGTFIAIPLEAQIKISNHINVIPSVTVMYYTNNRINYSGLILMGEIEAAYTSKINMNGWIIGIIPGIEYAIDSKKIGISIGAEVGYQWNIGKMIMLGLSGGVREVFMDGNITIPDIKARIGIRL